MQSRIILEGPEDYLLNSSGNYTPTSGLKYIIKCVERLDQINLSQQVRVLSEKVLGNELGNILMKGRGFIKQGGCCVVTHEKPKENTF